MRVPYGMRIFLFIAIIHGDFHAIHATGPGNVL